MSNADCRTQDCKQPEEQEHKQDKAQKETRTQEEKPSQSQVASTGVVEQDASGECKESVCEFASTISERVAIRKQHYPATRASQSTTRPPMSSFDYDQVPAEEGVCWKCVADNKAHQGHGCVKNWYLDDIIAMQFCSACKMEFEDAHANKSPDDNVCVACGRLEEASDNFLDCTNF